MQGCFVWRRWWDLNPRAPHQDNTISNRARYDHFDTSPYLKSTVLLYHVFLKKQVFLEKIFNLFFKL